MEKVERNVVSFFGTYQQDLMKHLRHDEIDLKKWDACVLSDPSGLPYALSWFLEIASPEWEGLVWGDYEVVMPLPVKYKWKLPYLVQPAGCQQLGLFGKGITLEIIDEAIRWIKKHYIYIHIYLNYHNAHPSLKERKNLILPLDEKYDTLYSFYHTNLKRNLKKSMNFENRVTETFIWDTLLHYFKQSPHFKETPRGWLDVIEKLGYEAFNRQVAKTVGLFSEKGEFLACANLLFTKNRIIFWFSATSAEGRNRSSMHYLIDYLIKKYAGSSMIFDFEGSENPTLARFYSSFGAIEQNYFSLKKFLI
jgi:hypothetical protein